MVKVNYDAKTGATLGYYPDGIGYKTIPEPYVEISEDQHKDAINNQGKYTVVNGVFTAAAVWPPVKSGEEIKQEKLNALDSEYQGQFTSLAESLGVATLDGNQTVIDGIKSDYADLKAEYQKAREAILNG